MTIIQRLERDSKARGEPESRFCLVDKADLAAVLACVKAMHDFIHDQTQNADRVFRLAAIRNRAEKKVGLK